MKEDLLKPFLEVANNPFESLRELKARKKIIGSTLADVPEEIIHAAGLHPFLILGTNEPIKVAAALMPDNACSLARSNLELVLAYQRDFFDGFVLSQVCDTTQHLCDIWKRRFQDRYFENFLAPRQVSRPSARRWVAVEMRRLKASLERFTGQEITEERLRKSIKLFNENRRLLAQLYDIKRRAPGILSNREFFDVVKAAFFMDRAEHTELLKPLLQWAEAEVEGWKAKDSFPAVVAGIVVEPPQIYDIFDEVGANIVTDNLPTASRYIYFPASEEGDPIEALAERHVSRPNFSPINDQVERVYTDLIELYRGYGARALFYIHIQYCESQDYDLPDIKRKMREEGIPMLVVETEYQTTHLALMKTRIEAFCEAVLGRV